MNKLKNFNAFAFVRMQNASWAVLHYMSSWDWVGMYFKMVGMDPNRYGGYGGYRLGGYGGYSGYRYGYGK